MVSVYISEQPNSRFLTHFFSYFRLMFSVLQQVAAQHGFKHVALVGLKMGSYLNKCVFMNQISISNSQFGTNSYSAG